MFDTTTDIYLKIKKRVREWQGGETEKQKQEKSTDIFINFKTKVNIYRCGYLSCDSTMKGTKINSHKIYISFYSVLHPILFTHSLFDLSSQAAIFDYIYE